MLKIVEIPRSTYYHRKHYRVEEKQISEGRPAPGYSMNKSGNKASDEQIKEFLLETIAGDGFNYGYRKLTKVLRREYKLIINKKKYIGYVKSWIFCDHNERRKPNILENLHETVRLRTPINSGRQILNTSISMGKIAFSSSCPL